MIIPERSRDIGDFLVGRLLPFRKKRMVGPFIFIDHMGPNDLGPGHYLDVDQHPHIGLATLTYLLAGEIEHRDSLGTVQTIRPGEVNWMVAGSGITHTERSPAELRNGAVYTLHGYQIWVALPPEAERASPSFFHASAADLPRWKEGQAELALIAGEIFKRRSPVPVHSPLYLLEIATNRTALDLNPAELYGEFGLIVISGEAEACAHKIAPSQLLVSKPGAEASLRLAPNGHYFLFGGESFERDHLMDWNFVASDEAKLQEARQRWKNKAFPGVPGDATYVPHPGDR